MKIGIALLWLGWIASLVFAQDKSVKPGINDQFRDPNVKDFVERFEGESREIFDKRQDVLKACQLKPGQIVADVGAGTGLYTRLFAQAVGEKGQVYAVDIAQKFLDHIQQSADKLSIKNIKLVLGTDISPKLPINSCDVVFICDTYHHFEFPFRVMNEIHRSLKPGGRVIVIDFIRIPGKSREWILNHVRAGQELVEKEIQEAGFKKVSEEKTLFKENYFVIFEKVTKPESSK